MILDCLGHRHGTDKASGSHNYLHFYEIFLQSIRDQKITVLEIGVGGGPSLKMWRDYFPRARIIGMDKEDKRSCSGDRIEIEIADQGNENHVRGIMERYGPFGLIVDDAGHQSELQASCYQIMLPSLMPGGYYILEDISGGPCKDMFRDLTPRVIEGHDRIESIAFYKDTSVTKVKNA